MEIPSLVGPNLPKLVTRLKKTTGPNDLVSVAENPPYNSELTGRECNVTEFIGIPLGVNPVCVLEYPFGSNIGNKISPDIGNGQGVISV